MAPNFPVGYKFHPRDEELVGYYLYNKVQGAPYKDEHVIPEIDLYGSMEARDIWNNNGGQNSEKDEDLYFFTKLKPASTGKAGKGSRMARTIGCGTWHGENSGTKVEDPKTKETIGWRKRFQYKNTKYPQENGCWIMHEFSLDPKLVMHIKSNSRTGNDDEYVVCRIRKNYDRKRKADDREETRAVQSQSNKIQRQLENTDESYVIPMSSKVVEEVNTDHYIEQQQQQTNLNATSTSNSIGVTNVDQPQCYYYGPQNSNVSPMYSEFVEVNVDHLYNQQQLEQSSNVTGLAQYYYYNTQDPMATMMPVSSSLGIAAWPDDFVADASCLPQPNSDARQEHYLQQNGSVDNVTDLSQYHYPSTQEPSSQLQYDSTNTVVNDLDQIPDFYFDMPQFDDGDGDFMIDLPFLDPEQPLGSSAVNTQQGLTATDNNYIGFGVAEDRTSGQLGIEYSRNEV